MPMMPSVPAPSTSLDQQALSFAQQYAALSAGWNGGTNDAYFPTTTANMPLPSSSDPSLAVNLLPSAVSPPRASAKSSKAARSNRRTKTKEELLAEQLAASDEAARKRSARVEALKRASDESEALAREQFAAKTARKKAALEKAKQAKEEKEREQEATRQAEEAKQAAERKRRLEDLKQRQAAKQAAEDERKRAESAASAAEQARREQEQADRKKKRDELLLAREAARARQKAALAETLAAESKAVEEKKNELDLAEADLRSREKRLKQLERAKSQSAQEAEQKLHALQQSIALAEKTREEALAEAEKAKKLTEADQATAKLKLKQKEERLKIELEQKIKRKLEWTQRRQQQNESTKAQTGNIVGGDANVLSAATPSTPSSSSPSATTVLSSTARSRARALADGSSTKSVNGPIPSRRPVAPARSTSTSVRARMYRVGRTTVPLRRTDGVAASNSTNWTPAMAREMHATWTFLFQRYGSFLPSERVAPCIAALVASRAHPRDAVDFTHQELHEMNVDNWRVRKDIIDVARAYLRRIQSEYVQSAGLKPLYDENGNVVHKSSIAEIMEEQIQREDETSSITSTPRHPKTGSLSNASPPPAHAFSSSTPFDSLMSLSSTFRPDRPSSSYVGPLFDANGMPVELADMAATFLKQQMEQAKQQQQQQQQQRVNNNAAAAEQKTEETINPVDATTIANATDSTSESTEPQPNVIVDVSSPAMSEDVPVPDDTPIPSKPIQHESSSSPSPSSSSSSVAASVPSKTYSLPVGPRSTLSTAKPKLSYSQMMAQRVAQKEAKSADGTNTATSDLTTSSSSSSSSSIPIPLSSPRSRIPTLAKFVEAHSSTTTAPADTNSSHPTNRLEPSSNAVRPTPTPHKVYKLFGKKTTPTATAVRTSHTTIASKD